MNKAQVVALLREQQSYLASEYGVRRIGLFGSFANGLPDDASDVDLVVEFARPIGFRFIALGDYLERILSRRVDILTPDGLRAIRRVSVAESIAKSIVYV
ncbi:MAG TPA: nucleotidyltransferase domain-containing protein [Anaerolineae bacterium]|jgi:predicted nucleotidyltransferase|nr:nucleotidyltransferase domain-containing protein [Anaerolineae bacterium]